MKLNFAILAQDLEEEGFFYSKKRASNKLTLLYPHVYELGEEISYDIIYIVDKDSIASATADAPDYMNFVCIGKPDESYFEHNNIIWTDKNINPSSLLNKLIKIFVFYDEWMNKVQDAFRKNKALRRIGELSEAIMNGPIWMWDCQYQTIFHVANNVEDYNFPEEYKMHKDSDPFPMEEINQVDDTFRNLQKQKVAYFLPAIFGYRSLCCNIFQDGIFTATISIDEIGKNIGAREAALLEELSRAISLNLTYQTHISKHSTFALDDVTKKLNDGKFVQREKITSALEKINWHINDAFFCLAATPEAGISYPEHFLLPIAERICDATKKMIFCAYDNLLILIINLGENVHKYYETAESIIKQFEKEKLLMNVGVSNIFFDYALLADFKMQAQSTIKLGLEKDEDKKLFYSEDYLIDAIIKRCTDGSSAEIFIPPCLLRLRDYDKKNGTNLLEILRTYLKESFNSNKTANALYIHRNTLSARIKEIEHVGMIDLNDGTARAYIYLGFLLLDSQSPL